MNVIESIPNFSQGRDKEVIRQIASAIGDVPGVNLLNVDPGVATNRTVMTFVGEAEAVVEAAFCGVRCASQLIDMRQHHGAHPRLGATDVLPLVPISGISLAQCAILARGLAQRISEQLGIPTYNYEAAASNPLRRNLADVRSGEYEGLAAKMVSELWRPDFGPHEFTPQVARSGATIVGARDFLVAVNFNLNTASAEQAQQIACDVREKGRKVNGLWQRGTLKGCKAIGWYIDEYQIAQVSMNITDIHLTPLHMAFEQVSARAAARGLRVTGTEIIGLVPLTVLSEAGRYFLQKQHLSSDVPMEELLRVASESMGLSDLSPFIAEQRVIEYLMK